MKLVITGGHHTAALPVIEEIKRNAPRTEVFWIGRKYTVAGDKNYSLEYRDITALNIPFFDLQAGKFYKTVDPLILLKLPVGLIQALYLLVKLKPAAILSFGSYLAVPVVVAGWFLGIPSFTHEQTLTAGYANRLIAIFAKKVLLSWPESARFFPKGKTFITGLPLRAEIFSVLSSVFEVNKALPTVYVTAGKTGSHKINLAVIHALKDLLAVCNIIHQCGANSVFNDYELAVQTYAELQENEVVRGKYCPRRFVLGNEIGEVYAKSTLVISRGGAHTVGELLALEKPCLLIPIPWVSHNEQNINASVLVKSGLGKILNESELTSETLLLNVKAFLENIGDYKVKNSNHSSIIAKNAAHSIYQQISQFLR